MTPGEVEIRRAELQEQRQMLLGRLKAINLQLEEVDDNLVELNTNVYAPAREIR